MGGNSSGNPDLVRESVVVGHWMSEKYAELPWVRVGPLSLGTPETSLWDAIPTGWGEASHGWCRAQHRRSKKQMRKKDLKRNLFFLYCLSNAPLLTNLNMMQAAKKNHKGPKSIFIKQATWGRFGAERYK